MSTPILRLLIPALALLMAGGAFAHGDGEPLFVSQDGTDAGDCKDAAAPCATIGYALGQSGKGGEIRVAEGTYGVTSAEDVFHLVSGVLDVRGGFRRANRFASPSQQGVSVLAGVPSEYRSLLESRGFQVVSDQKFGGENGADKLLQQYRALKSSLPASPCVGGLAGMLPCNQVDLLSHVGFADMSVTPSAGTDVWGFVDLNSGREYAIVGFNIGTAVFDVTDAENPREIGFIDGQDTIWRDIKVYQYYDAAADRWQAYAYVTTDGSTDGLFVIDMTGLPHTISKVDYPSDFVRAHNVYAANTDYSTGVTLNGDLPDLIIAGSNIGQDEARGRYRSYSLANPAAPALMGFAPTDPDPVNPGKDFYMHDAASVLITDGRKDTQCVNAGDYCQVLLDFNEEHIEIWDISDAANPASLSTTGYAQASYVHSGWWSEDRQYMFVHDEIDEQRHNLATTVRVFSLADLRSPQLVETWSGSTTAIDHNGFVRGNRYYMSNYSRGLTILDITDPTSIPAEIGRLDTYPVGDGRMYNGAWGAYPFFWSGNVAISDIDSGFYMARDNTRDVPEGSFSFAATSSAVEEGQQVQVMVERGGGMTGAVSVDYEIVGATAGTADVQLASGTMQWAGGDNAAKAISIDAVADGNAEGVEQMLLRLVNPTGGATLADQSTASLYINDPGAAATVGFADAAIETTERGFGTLVAILKRRGSAQGAVSVDYSMTAGDASGGTDFQGTTSGTVSWAAGDGDPKTLEFFVSDDGVLENDEFFELSLSNASGATIAGNDKLTATILNAGGTNLPPIANAGPNQIRTSGSSVTLDGSLSSDPNGDSLSFQWAQTAGPSASLSNANQSIATFTAPSVSSDSMLQFELTVSDPAGLSSIASVTITVTRANAPAAAPSSSGGGALSVQMLALFGLLGLGRRFSRRGVAG